MFINVCFVLLIHRMVQGNPGTSCKPMTGKTEPHFIHHCPTHTPLDTHTHTHTRAITLTQTH